MRNEAVETIEYKGYNINIYQDESTESPREFSEHFTKMVFFHNRYSLGDKHNFDIEEIKELVKRKDIIALPLYLYEHGNITMNTTGFSCRWDSGQVGCIYVDFETIKKEYNVKRISKKLIEKVKNLMIAEVETYDNYISGSVYGYMIETPEGDEEGGCWGFYGYEYEKNGLEDSAKEEINWLIAERKEIVDNIAIQVI